MAEDQYRSQFRLPYPLCERLKQAADGERRSVNAEIVLRLEASFANNALIEQLLHVLEERDRRLVDELRAFTQDLLLK